MIETLDFLEEVLPSDGCILLATPQKEGRGFIHYPCKTKDEAARKCHELDYKEQQVYFACATYKQDCYVDEAGKTRYRTAENAYMAKSFWLDIDCGIEKASEGKGYETPKAAVNALKVFCAQVSLPIPMIVASGNGLHCYWVLETSVDRESWKEVALQLKALTQHFQFLADDSRTSDIASILRPVGTHNWKPACRGKEIKRMFNSAPIAFEGFSQTIQLAYQQYCAVLMNQNLSINDDLIRDEPETPENVNRIKSALASIDPDCDRLKWRNICFALHSTNWSCAEALARSWSSGEFL